MISCPEKSIRGSIQAEMKNAGFLCYTAEVDCRSVTLFSESLKMEYITRYMTEKNGIIYLTSFLDKIKLLPSY